MTEQEDRNTQIRWFGPSPWNAKVCEIAMRSDVPVGQQCMFCKEPIKQTDRGVLLYEVSKMRHLPTHLGCMVKQILPASVIQEMQNPASDTE